jgi:protein-arginine kinase activator protein McsA
MLINGMRTNWIQHQHHQKMSNMYAVSEKAMFQPTLNQIRQCPRCNAIHARWQKVKDGLVCHNCKSTFHLQNIVKVAKIDEHGNAQAVENIPDEVRKYISFMTK